MGRLVAIDGWVWTLIDKAECTWRSRRLSVGVAPPLGLVLDVRLAGAGGRERPRGDVVGDDRSGAGVRLVADRHRRDERRVDRRADVGADRRAVLVATVVIRRDRRGAQVRAGPDVGVTDVAQVRHLRALADVRVLDLDERPRLGPLAQEGAGAEVGEWPHRGAGPYLAPLQVGVDDGHAVAEYRVD